jgi:hypothetical protein
MWSPPTPQTNSASLPPSGRSDVDKHAPDNIKSKTHETKYQNATPRHAHCLAGR